MHGRSVPHALHQLNKTHNGNRLNISITLFICIKIGPFSENEAPFKVTIPSCYPGLRRRCKSKNLFTVLTVNFVRLEARPPLTTR
jgi:hypothetical protein